ncbi:MAG: carbohydrate ABC transporter permease [Actinobacteria bacterium]|nr:carbohydrate ABC transporter permease [Actinomycetota bacterium]
MKIFKNKRFFYLILIYGFLILLSIIIVYPFLWMLIASLKLSDNAMFSQSIFEIFKFKDIGFKNYTTLASISSPPLLKMAVNSIVTTIGSTVINIVVCFFAAYMLAKHKVAGGKFLFFFFISMMIIPQEVVAVPLYLVLNSLGLINSYQGIIYSLSAEALSIIILYRFFKEIPNEIIEASYIDGASELNLIFKIIFPLSWPAVMSAILLQFIGSWNAFIIPLITAVDERLYTLQIGMTYFSSSLYVDFRSIMALGSIITIPIILIYILTQKRVIQGITAGAIKE